MNRTFVSSNGDLLTNQTQPRVVRERYSYHFREISNTHQLRATLRAGTSTLLGGYPLYLLASDGEPLHFKCAREEYRQISESVRNKSNDGWRVVGCDINYEDPAMYCVHCGKRIESAYAEERVQS